MNFDDLNKAIHMAKTLNLQVSAKELNMTAGALSKTLKRIELKLNTPIFDRVGRNIHLNDQGKKFIQYAAKLVHEYDQMCSEFNDKKITQVVNIAGPSVLLNHGKDTLLSLLGKHKMAINIDAVYEGDAVALLEKSLTHIAIVTSEALTSKTSLDIRQVPLGVTTSQIVVAKNHPLLLGKETNELLLKDILQYAFVCPNSSPFCGVSRGVGSDGWPDLEHPRNILYRTDDVNTLLSLVMQGHAIAYVPDIVIKGNDLTAISVSDLKHSYQESYCLLYKPSQAYGWLNRLVAEITS